MLACLPLVLACLWVAGAQVWAHEGEWAAKSVMLGVAIGLSVSGYLGVHALMRSEELDLIWGMVKRKLGREARG
jgi:putative peptidoglycan lipid II flippase